MSPIGAHMSIAGGLYKTFGRILTVGGECLQLFVKPNVQWRAGDLGLDEVACFKEERKNSGIKTVVAHASYLLNLATSDKELREKSILTLALELVRCARLDIEYLVLHPGSAGESGEKKGLRRIAKGIDRAFSRVDAPGPKILLETMAGAGSQLGCRLEQLKDLLDLSRYPDRLGVCLDTCHVFAAGYDLASAEGFEDYFQSFQRLLGLNRLKVIHANDSKSPPGSKVDRHEQIGRGTLGLPFFKRLLNDPRLKGIPFILETPKGNPKEENWDRLNIALLKSLRPTPPVQP
ncbi:MAG TPA: deoxyribonuclease IV [Thermodesulfobacteriota bacterium]|nr:deoxyribonuclease IV [Thermodesulfobacteriota bacterium]